MVLRELTKALDDPKRAVRKEAVDARSVHTISRYLSASFTPFSQDKLVYVLWLEDGTRLATRKHRDNTTAVG